MKDLIADVYNIIENGISNNAERELLAQSLFYYCSGIDPTPIIAFGSDYPLYIYSDIIDYGNGDFNKTMNVLYERLFKAGFVCVDNKRITHLKTIQNIEVTLWKAEGNLFSLAYIQHDAVMSFQKIYSDGSNNYIQPKCICNYRNESARQSNFAFFSQIEKRTEYIMGHCFCDKYKAVSKHIYYGDYEANTQVTLFHRMFWYVY
ncbi:hypothetical protein [Ruminococcus callidus]|jgi:hypothetical protein|uniref:hypothetical protein n=1 Tax=Ruminococcus callidus TaxID=40519 RepID=UPI002671ECD2|nr:hypothetical protein [uncultured Ruminococcus sp.]